MRPLYDYLILTIVYITFACIWASALLLYGVWRETRMVMQLLNGACLP
jgi:hypothetical protein